MMRIKLQVVLPDGWEDITDENPGGPATYCRTSENAEASDATGALQISIQGSYDSEQVTHPSEADLIRMCELVAHEQNAEVHQRSSGEGVAGRFGCIVCKTAEIEWMQIWTLSTGRHFILATYLAESTPAAKELNEVDQIVKSVRVVRQSL